ncbi:MAG: DNA-binding protein [Porticoccus sp.]|jgi:hypothetical protein|uniref:helix-turn-helix domain-containing protein n=1 Tax=Porticoccus TaxID=1123967 RepID=UPI000560DEFC|nr:MULTISPECIES: helix-turn-helix domain-containing protein [Porticoccus]MAZ70432.1 DNA-binding protein [Porticoccus sp.]MBG58507.1 DNA-binding protein [Porticoccus sp.]|tara:strand:- start:7291 stop:7728 length:438 start_codon:yes stop_codon:yes gene_type:complete
MANYNPNLAKIHRNYTVEEVASLFGIHKNTVRGWIKTGMPVCDDRRPTLILGYEIRRYLQRTRTAGKQRCKPFELYCMRCRSPRKPAENMVDFTPINETTGRLVGICPDCETLMNRYANKSSLAQIRQHLEVCFPIGQKHISKTS